MICRWLFYPPDKIPPGVVVSVSEDGSLDVDAPNPVRWLLEVSVFESWLDDNPPQPSFVVKIDINYHVGETALHCCGVICYVLQ